MKHKFYPVRYNLHQEIVVNNRFPFWTEKIYSGFPIYADIENAYLHPLNLLFTVTLGPILSYKVLHFLMYLIGSYGLYNLLRKKKVGYLGYFVTNLIFFFSFYFLNKQIHQSLILTIYTFPMSVYLLSQYINTNLNKYVAWSILLLSSAFYWGHPQIFLIYCIGFVIYGISYIEKENLKKLFIYFLSVFWFVFLISLPQLLPSLRLNSLSTRAFDSENIMASQGSYNPLMFTNLFFPEIFLNSANYQGEDVNSDYSYVETYSYIGITTFLLFFLGLAYLRDSKLQRFVLISFFTYLFLSYSSYIPAFNIDTLPILSLFRYWTRSHILFLFAISLVVGLLVDKLAKGEVYPSRPNYKNVLYIPIALILIFSINLNNPTTIDILHRLITYVPTSYVFNEYVFLLTIISLVLGLIIFLFKRNSKSPILGLIAIVLPVFILIDLMYFSRDLIDIRTDNIKDLTKIEISETFKNKRVIVEKGEIENNESLYYDFWWPYGYSQFRDKEYYNNFKSNEISEISRPENVDLVPAKYDFYNSIGVVSIISDDNIETLNKNNIDLIKQSVEGDYINKEEGYIVFKLHVKEPTILHTYIKNLPGWQVYIDGYKADLGEELFIQLNITEGAHIVELRYIPYDFYYGLLLAVTGLCISFIVLFGRNFSFVRTYNIYKDKFLEGRFGY